MNIPAQFPPNQAGGYARGQNKMWRRKSGNPNECRLSGPLRHIFSLATYPVRLQTRLTPRPPSRARPHPLIGRHCRYLRPRRFVRSGSCDQAAPKTSDHDRESSGPWLPSRLYCPAGSSLTMATSAPLSATQRLMDYSARLRVQPASRRGSPIYSASPFTPCRRPYSGGPSDCTRRCLHRWFCLRHFRTGSATTSPTNPDSRGSRNEAAAFA